MWHGVQQKQIKEVPSFINTNICLKCFSTDIQGMQGTNNVAGCEISAISRTDNMDGISFSCWFRFLNLWQGTSSHRGNFADYWGFPPLGPFTVTRRPETAESCFLIKVNEILLFHWRTERLLHPAAARWSPRGNLVLKQEKYC